VTSSTAAACPVSSGRDSDVGLGLLQVTGLPGNPQVAEV
jgi:hypothetical protein